MNINFLLKFRDGALYGDICVARIIVMFCNFNVRKALRTVVFFTPNEIVQKNFNIRILERGRVKSEENIQYRAPTGIAWQVNTYLVCAVRRSRCPRLRGKGWTLLK